MKTLTSPVVELGENLLPMDGQAFLCENFFSEEDCRRWMSVLLKQVNWQQRAIRLFGKEVLQPRKVAWHGDPGKSYTYSGLTLEPEPWLPELKEIKQGVETFLETSFNSVLLNLYRNEQDSMGWHRDNEKELGKDPLIASISLGETRRFRLQHLRKKDLKADLLLDGGSLLVMRGETQSHWRHCLPKQKATCDQRVNLTFRQVEL